MNRFCLSFLMIMVLPIKSLSSQLQNLFLNFFLLNHTKIILLVDDFIAKVNDDFQDAIEKLAVQSKTKISLATSQFEASILESQGNLGSRCSYSCFVEL